MWAWMVVGEFALFPEDPVCFFDHFVILEAAAENKVGDYMVEGSVGEFEGFDVHDLEFDVISATGLSLLPRNIEPASEHVNPDYGDTST